MSGMVGDAMRAAANVSLARYNKHQIPDGLVAALYGENAMAAMNLIIQYPDHVLNAVENILFQAFERGEHKIDEWDRFSAAMLLAKEFSTGNLARLVVHAEMLQRLKDPLKALAGDFVQTDASKRILEILQQIAEVDRCEVLTPKTMIALMEGGAPLEHILDLLPAAARRESIAEAGNLLVEATQQGSVRTTREPIMMVMLLQAEEVLSKAPYFERYYRDGKSIEQVFHALNKNPVDFDPTYPGPMLI